MCLHGQLFRVLDKSPLSGPGRGPLSCNTGILPVCMSVSKSPPLYRHLSWQMKGLPTSVWHHLNQLFPNESTCWDTWRRKWQPTPVLLPGKSHGWRSLVGYSPWGCKELDTTERLHFHFSLSCTGEGNGNPLQYSCLENPSDGGVWWAAIYGVAQSQTLLKWLSSSSSWDTGGSHIKVLLLLLRRQNSPPNT